jgi:hypothetical protein
MPFGRFPGLYEGVFSFVLTHNFLLCTMAFLCGVFADG